MEDVCVKTPVELRKRGNGNLGDAGIGHFIRSHKCGSLCKKLGLIPFDLTRSERTHSNVHLSSGTVVGLSTFDSVDGLENSAPSRCDGDNAIRSLDATRARQSLASWMDYFRSLSTPRADEDVVQRSRHAVSMHRSVSYAYAHDVQQGVKTWRSVAHDDAFLYHVVRAGLACEHRSHWIAVLELLRQYFDSCVGDVSRSLTAAETMRAVPTPPAHVLRTSKMQAIDWTYFFLWWSDLPEGLKLQHVFRSQFFCDDGFWNHAQSEVASAKSEVRDVSGHANVALARSWARGLFRRDGGDFTRVRTRVALGAVTAAVAATALVLFFRTRGSAG